LWKSTTPQRAAWHPESRTHEQRFRVEKVEERTNRRRRRNLITGRAVGTLNLNKEEAMKTKMLPTLLLMFSTALFVLNFGCSTVTGAGDGKEVPRMTIDDLKSRLTDASLVVIDVRQGNDWTGSSVKIKGAVREDPAKVSEWTAKYSKDRTLVLYCA
jgi:hypothetical protein